MGGASFPRAGLTGGEAPGMEKKLVCPPVGKDINPQPVEFEGQVGHPSEMASCRMLS